MNNARLILLRHGESLWNKDNRFTGWVDVPLTEKGKQEADIAGKKIFKAGLFPDFVCTSVMTRCIHTVWRVLDQLDCSWMPVDKTWRLNERHYGVLQELDKEVIALLMGHEQVHLWRKSYREIPPPDRDAPAQLQQDPRYRHVALSDLPMTESLEMTIRRVLPYWQNVLEPQLRSGKTVLIVAHGNSLRALIMFLKGMDENEIMNLSVPNGIPVVYEFDAELHVVAEYDI